MAGPTSRLPAPQHSLAVALAALICLALVLLRPEAARQTTIMHNAAAEEPKQIQNKATATVPHAGLLPAAGEQCLTPKSADWLTQVPGSDQKFFSQQGEDGILLNIFRNIGTTNQYYVEFGTEDGRECNTRFLREVLGWSGLLMDGGYENPNINQHREFISPENINDLFVKHGVPNEFDLLSIDIDFDDFYVWKAIKQTYRPRVVVIEFNGFLPINESLTVDPKDPQRWTGTMYTGASARAIFTLGHKKGYDLVATDKIGVNLFFVRSDILACQGVQPLPYERLFNHATFPPHSEETNTSRKWLHLDDQLNVVKREWLRLPGR